jgi:hypothetical protein
MGDVGFCRAGEVLRGYVRRADMLKDHAGAAFSSGRPA